MARVRLLARRIDVNGQAALLCRDIAGEVGRIHDVLNGAAVAPDFNQSDADADVEYLVLPDEAIVVDRTHHAVGNLPGFLQRTAGQQQGELIAADAADPVRIAHRLLDERSNLAQHIFS